MRRSALFSALQAPLLFVALQAHAQETFSLSPDTTLAVGTGALLSVDEGVVTEDSPGTFALEDLGTLPEASEVVAFGWAANGDRLFVLDATTELAGGVLARPKNVVRYDGTTYSLEFDGELEGLPGGVGIDAVTASGSDLVFSLDTTASLSSGLTVSDEDLVRWTGSGFEIALDGSAVGIGPELDIDGAQERGSGGFAVSFDTSGSVGGIAFGDEDVLEYDGAVWTLALDSSASDPDWQAADADAIAIPEPGTALGLMAGMLALGLARRRGQEAGAGTSQSMKWPPSASLHEPLARRTP